MRAEFTHKGRLINGGIVEGAESISEFGEQWDDLFARAVDSPPYLARSWVSTLVDEGRNRSTPHKSKAG